MRRNILFQKARRALVAPLPLLGLVAAVGPLALASGSVAEQLTPAEAAYRALPALPTGSPDRGRTGVEASAIDLAQSLGGVPVDALGGVCDKGSLQVSWTEPGDGYEVGAFVSPVGPAPTETTTSVNGIVTCATSTYGYMGFEARWTGSRWDVVNTPFVGGEEDDANLVALPAPVVPAGPKPVPVLAAPGTVTGPIEGYAAYEPQRTCDPTAKVGTKSLAGALLRDYAGTRNLGIVRGCSVGGTSEHKEGRAFDWGVNVTNAKEKADAESFINALLATDSAGNKNALMRRMGVMYIIFDRQILSSYRINEGWRPYSGASAHRDHVHISMSWAGALGRTSFWSGTVPPDLPTASPSTSTVAASRRSTSSRSSTRSSASSTTHTRTRTHVVRDAVGDAPSVQGSTRHGHWGSGDGEHHWTPPSTTTTTAPRTDADETESQQQRSSGWGGHHRRDGGGASWTPPSTTTTVAPPQTTTTTPASQPTQSSSDGSGEHHQHHRGGWGSGTPTTTAPPATTTTTAAPETTTTTTAG